MSDSLQPHGLQHTRFLCPVSPGVCWDSCPLSWWFHPIISSSTAPFSCLPSFPPGSFPVSWAFTSKYGGQSIGTSLQHQSFQWIFRVDFLYHLVYLYHSFTDFLYHTCLISWQSKGLSGVFSSTTIWKHQFFGAQSFYGPSLVSVFDYWKNHSFHYMDVSQQSDFSAF